MDTINFVNCGQHGMVNVVPIAVEPMWAIPTEESVLEFIGQIAGECYNSSMDHDKCVNRALNVIKRGHHSPWEHYSITLKCLVDRGTSHAIVRHRHCAFQQASTIYQNFQKQGCLNIVALPEKDPYDPSPVYQMTEDEFDLYNKMAMEYMKKISNGVRPGRARDTIPICLATTLIITANFRQWMYMLQQRNGPGDETRMHCWDFMVRNWFYKNFPRATMAFETWYENGRKM